MQTVSIPNRDLDELQFFHHYRDPTNPAVSIPNRDLDELQCYPASKYGNEPETVSIPNRDLDELQFGQIGRDSQLVIGFNP